MSSLQSEESDNPPIQSIDQTFVWLRRDLVIAVLNQIANHGRIDKTDLIHALNTMPSLITISRDTAPPDAAPISTTYPIVSVAPSNVNSLNHHDAQSLALVKHHDTARTGVVAAPDCQGYSSQRPTSSSSNNLCASSTIQEQHQSVHGASDQATSLSKDLEDAPEKIRKLTKINHGTTHGKGVGPRDKPMPATNLRKNSRVTSNNYAKFSHAPSMEEVQNAHAICVSCWLLDLECNHKSPCSCCKAAKFNQCYYIRCPSNGCKLSNKCPAYHTTKETSIATFNSLHLLALVKIPCSQLRPESLKASRATLDAQNVQWLFGQIREKLKSPHPGVQIDEDYIKTLIVGVLPEESMTKESLDKDARFMMNFVDETSIGPFHELWMREEKIQKRSDKFASLGSSA